MCVHVSIEREGLSQYYCERIYFCVYTFSWIYENGQFRMYQNLRFKFNWLFVLLLKKCSMLTYFRGYLKNANYAKICTTQKYLHSQYTFSIRIIVQ